MQKHAFGQQKNKPSWWRLGLLLVGLLCVFFVGNAQAVCSAYKNLATINEVHRSGNATRFIEVKLLDASIASSTYDGWTISACSVSGCSGDISLSSADDSGFPYIVADKPLITSRWYINLDSGFLGGSDYILKDSSGYTIDYLSVNDFQNRFWGWNNQYDASCASTFDWQHPGTNTHTLAREPDGTGDWSDDAGNSGGDTESNTNDTTPPPDGGSIEVLSTADVTVDAGTDASFVVSLSNAPKSYDVSFTYTAMDNTALAGTDYTSTSGSATIPAGDTQVIVDVPTLSSSAGGNEFYFFISNPVNATIVNHVVNGYINANAGIAYFVLSHNNVGIHCLAESIIVTAKKMDGTTDTNYLGSVVLDTQSGNGNWALNTGSGSFNDATGDDGLATYTFVAADNGQAVFDLNYQTGTTSIDVDVYAGAIRDDDSEGNLLFSPSGFTVTANALSNPPPGVVITSIPAQTAASDFQLYLAAYGQTPTNPVCGIIETYTGAKNLKFWSSYNNPNTGTLPVQVNSVSSFANEAAANAGASQSVTFNNGQAVITVNYADVGQITLAMKDDTVTADLPTGIRGGSDPFVVKPAGFLLSNIQRTSDSLANPATATDETGAAFMAAGDDFSVTVTAVNSLGNATPNYGQETVPETVLLSPSLVAAGAANNPPIGFTTGFDGFVAGIDTGTDFHWDEVGIITLTPSVGDGDYLGAGDVTGTVSANVGRFYPDHFATATTAGSFANTCTAATAFTYLGEDFAYLSSPTATVTAQSALNTTTQNYTDVWAKLSVAGVSLTYPTADNSQLDEGGVNPLAVTATAGSLGRVDNNDGTLTFTLGGGSADSFAYVRDAGQVAPFTADLSIQLTAVNDGEASANDLATPKDITPAGNQIRFGRGDAQDVYGTQSQVGDSLVMPIRSWYLNASSVWVMNSDDSCTTYTYSKIDTSITATAAPASPVTLASGVGDLTLTLTDSGNPGGSSVVDMVWPSWLQFDYDGIDQLADGNLYDDNASGIATFGLYRGDDRFIYWREAP